MTRKTAQRDAIREVICQANRPLTVEDILEIGRNNVKTLNLATVYRNLKILVDSGWLRIINHPKLGNLYEKAGKGHHHHFHCHDCDRLYEMPGCALNEKKMTPPGFVTEDHEVFLFGLCPACLQRKSAVSPAAGKKR